MEFFGQVIVALLTILLVSKILQICRIVLWRPYVVTKSFRKQGIIGPPYLLVSGSLKQKKKLEEDALEIILDTHSHDFTERVVPHQNKWSSQYGETFLYWHGTEPKIYISDAELAKQVLSNDFYGKASFTPTLLVLIGIGLPSIDGENWLRHRTIINPAFTIDKLKLMVSEMAACVVSMLEEWKIQINTSVDQRKTIEMKREIIKLTGDIIAHAAFGFNYKEGEEAFEAQAELQKYGAASYNAELFIPGSQYLPTPTNIQIWKLDRKVKNIVRKVIERRLNAKATGSSDGYGDDVLGVMIESSEMVQSESNLKLKMDEIIEECKTFFFAGHETTTYLLIWTLFLLCVHPEWQSKLREEVLKEFGMEVPDADKLTKLKLVNMVLLETLRLYSPILELQRVASGDVKLGNITIPKGTGIVVPLLKIHRNKKYWGEDADKFNPLRFANGISQASKHPHALLAFGAGPRSCIGQTFTMIESKIAVALILQRFSLSLSPEYMHAPVHQLNLLPQFGLPIIVKSLR
ncbi:hypothetical protein ACOSQ2_000672 [Xanthoceras sorbifolium]|uniref:Cytochrome P450 n=1 Tax=Xanthoceras sorbifolium TaxID=99658 RepID=A0ABQ8INS9_9ROSI|nr:hypothetical protein JRO89_XS01G0348400 [Xanthoceras sorbifolium]